MTPEAFGELKAHVARALRAWEANEGQSLNLEQTDAFERLAAPVAVAFPWEEHESMDEQAVYIALALVAGPEMPAPPEAFAHQVVEHLQAELAEDAQRAFRAHEIVVAHCLGWRRPDIDWHSGVWDGIPPVAREILRRVVYRAVDECLIPLGNLVIGFPQGEDPREWTERVLPVFLAENGICQCWTRVAGFAIPHPEAVDINTLRRNARSKALTCLAQHNLRAWRPAARSLWKFTRQAVKGFPGEALRPAGLPTGMLFDRLHHQAEIDEVYGGVYRLELVDMAERHCVTCDVWTVAERCRNCGAALTVAEAGRTRRAQRYCRACDRWVVSQTCTSCRRILDPIDARTRIARARLINPDEERGSYRPYRVWTCPICGNIYRAHRCLEECPDDAGHDSCPVCRAPHNQKVWICPRCRKSYPAQRCLDGCPNGAGHDTCPGCGARHGRNRRFARLRTVYFYQGKLPPPRPPEADAQEDTDDE